MSREKMANQNERLLELQERMEKIEHKYMIMSGKGGVGKSTISVNMAWILAGQGEKVGLLDADLHGPSLPWMLGIKAGMLPAKDGFIEPVMITPELGVVSIGLQLDDNDQPMIWRGPIKMGVIQQFLGMVAWGNLDYLIIDSPPGTGDEPLSIAQLVPEIDGVIIVTTPQDVALLDARKSVLFAQRLKLPVTGIIENMSGFVCPACGQQIDLFKSGGGQRAAEELGVPFLGRLPLDPEIMRSGDKGEPFIQGYQESKTARIMEDIVERAINERK